MRKSIGIYRGKRIDTGTWKEGYLLGLQDKLTGKDLFFIVDENGEYHRVDPETVGEYTGLTDSNGTGIFEGDILCSFVANRKVTSIVKIGAYKPDFFYDFAHEHGYDMSVKVYGLYAYVFSNRSDIMLAANMKLASVIGNIYDNPELLRGDNDD